MQEDVQNAGNLYTEMGGNRASGLTAPSEVVTMAGPIDAGSDAAPTPSEPQKVGSVATKQKSFDRFGHRAPSVKQKLELSQSKKRAGKALLEAANTEAVLAI